MNTPPDSPDSPEVQAGPDKLLEQYTAYLEDIGRIGERYESSKNFYVTIISAIFTFLTLAGKDSSILKLDDKFLWLVALIGMGICVLWIVHTHSVTVLFNFKFRILELIEAKASLYPAFKKETEWLFQPGLRPEKLKNMKYIPMMPINIGVAVLFFVLFVVLPFLKA
jgi:hypothetical protein